tara:strand:- start:240 stop:362 length:123 start_codon:yes stop_codon:yes gene_type:complete
MNSPDQVNDLPFSVDDREVVLDDVRYIGRAIKDGLEAIYS